METLKLSNILNGHQDRVWCLSWNYNGKLLASCSGDTSIRIWNYSNTLNKWECVSVLGKKHKKTIRCVAWSPCGNYLASAGFDGVVWIEQLINRDPVEFKLITDLASHNYEVKSVSWSISGKFLATCARDKTVHIWDMEDIESPECVETLYSHTQDVKSVKWHPCIDILASCSYDNSIKIYKMEMEEYAVAASLNGHLSTVLNIEFNSDGNILASCGDDKTIRLWLSMDDQFSKWICASVLDGYHSRVVYDLSWAPCSNLLASVGADNCICLFRINEDNANCGLSVDYVTTVRNAHNEDVNCCSWQPSINGQMILATGSDDFLIKLWQFIDPDMPID